MHADSQVVQAERIDVFSFVIHRPIRLTNTINNRGFQGSIVGENRHGHGFCFVAKRGHETPRGRWNIFVCNVQ